MNTGKEISNFQDYGWENHKSKYADTTPKQQGEKTHIYDASKH